jgi:hypothetical protein
VLADADTFALMLSTLSPRHSAVQAVLVVLSAAFVTGCPKDDKPKDNATPATSASTKTTSATTPAASGSAAAAATAAASSDVPAKPVDSVCKTDGQKVWTKGVSASAGLTALELPDGTDLVGFAIGSTPHVLDVKAAGAGTMNKVAIDPGNRFAKAPKDGARYVWRVTPTKGGGAGKYGALVDYRDEAKLATPPEHTQATKTRTVACGPVDQPKGGVVWEGANILDEPKHAKDPLHVLSEANLLGHGVVYDEVRDCRSFYDAEHGAYWVVGSDLHVEGEGDKPTAKSELFIQVQGDAKREVVTSMPVTTAPFKLVAYESPVSHQLGDASMLIMARTPSALVGMAVGKDKKVIGKVAEYKGMFQMPDLAADAKDDVLVTAQHTGKDGMALRAGRIASDSNALPATLTQVDANEVETKTESRPEFLRDAKGQRWIAYLEDAEKGKGNLQIVPVTATFRAAGKAYRITGEAEKAAEARVIAKKGGGFVVAYLRDAGAAGNELVTEDLTCEVKQ